MFKVKILKKAAKSVLSQLNYLTSQLSLTATAPKPTSLSYLKKMLSQKDFYLLAIRSKGVIAASLIVYLTKIPTGIIAEVEDLIVDAPYRAWGLGRILIEKAIDIAQKKRAKHISLRTNPKRVDANKMYQSMGFMKVETNFYRINFPRK